MLQSFFGKFCLYNILNNILKLVLTVQKLDLRNSRPLRLISFIRLRYKIKNAGLEVSNQRKLSAQSVFPGKSR